MLLRLDRVNLLDRMGMYPCLKFWDRCMPVLRMYVCVCVCVALSYALASLNYYTGLLEEIEAHTAKVGRQSSDESTGSTK